MNFLKTALGFVTGGASTWIVYAAIAAFAAGTGAYGAHRFDLGAIDSMKLASAQNTTQVLQQQAVALQGESDKQLAEANAVTGQAIAEASAQQIVQTKTVTITKEVPVYVTPHTDSVVISCIPYGFVRVLDAAIPGSGANGDPSALPLPSGQSDDSCAPISASVLAERLVADLGVAEANAEQLDALEAAVAALTKEADGQ
jgi:hypothetical protein